MCDQDIHQGLVQDSKLTRRSFVATGVIAAGFATSAYADNVVEKDVMVKTADGEADAAIFYPTGKGTCRRCWSGRTSSALRPVFREMGRRLAAQGYVVLVPNPFYRSKRAPVVDGAFDSARPRTATR